MKWQRLIFFSSYFILATSQNAIAKEKISAENKINIYWISAKDELKKAIALPAENTITIIESFKKLINKGLLNPETQTKNLELYNKYGTKKDNYLGLRPLSNKKAENKKEIKNLLLLTNKTSIGKEYKPDFIPQKIKDGFSFSSKKSSLSTSLARPKDNIRYGLVVTDISPSESHYSLALNEEEQMDYFLAAPAAKISYDISPLSSEGSSHYPSFSEEEKTKENLWGKYIPSHEFSGSIKAKELPNAGKLIPAQILTLSTSDGFYSLESQLSGLSPDSMLHRFRYPLWGKVVVYRELNKDLKIVKTGIENLYSSKNISSRFEHLNLEKRYSASFLYSRPLLSIELLGFLPSLALAKEIHYYNFEIKIAQAI